MRDFALSLPAFHLRRHRVILKGEFVPVPASVVRPIGPLDRLTDRASMAAHRTTASPTPHD
jgi:hypothetical protein